mmetsp:Transcript_30318/g.69893  ORF Transcript_30318/g.69893 Transcript_30318/m.69893 type:complete len:204 (-) Transcript_30318:199-810(-)
MITFDKWHTTGRGTGAALVMGSESIADSSLGLFFLLLWVPDPDHSPTHVGYDKIQERFVWRRKANLSMRFLAIFHRHGFPEAQEKDRIRFRFAAGTTTAVLGFEEYDQVLDHFKWNVQPSTILGLVFHSPLEKRALELSTRSNHWNQRVIVAANGISPIQRVVILCLCCHRGFRQTGDALLQEGFRILDIVRKASFPQVGCQL